MDVLHLAASEVARHPQLQLLVQLLEHEATGAESGSELVVPRLVDALVVFVMRAWLDGQPVGSGGWFGALRDPAIAKALARIHQEPATAWTVEGLAREVAQSRATFARRFAELVTRRRSRVSWWSRRRCSRWPPTSGRLPLGVRLGEGRPLPGRPGAGSSLRRRDAARHRR